MTELSGILDANQIFMKIEMVQRLLKAALKKLVIKKSINLIKCTSDTRIMTSGYTAHFINEGINDPYNNNEFGIAFRCKTTKVGQTSLCDSGNVITVKSVYLNSDGNSEDITSTIIDER